MYGWRWLAGEAASPASGRANCSACPCDQDPFFISPIDKSWALFICCLYLDKLKNRLRMGLSRPSAMSGRRNGKDDNMN
ncbi:unnamed protein product [Protopolystoma xenopodis]|uniref:Uncharacterized protein n=1 Tax=Protopolystoma xenopodis TaxID=117903 RepID=A0A448WXR4_9PLAT|nr:unnamed protein product [Protopolystoma xenopodis]